MEFSPATRAYIFPPASLAHGEEDRSLATPPLRVFPEQQKAGGLAEVWGVIKEHRGLLLAAAMVGLAAGIGVSFLQTPQYQARAALLIQNPNLDFMNTRQVNPTAEQPNTDNGLTDITTQIQVIGSDHIIDRVIRRLRVDGKIGPLEQQVKSGRVRRFFSRSSPTEKDLNYDMHQMVAKHLNVKEVGPTRAVEILYAAPNSEFSASLVNAVASEYVESSLEQHLNKSQQTENWLSDQLEGMRARLQTSERQLQDYASSSGLLFTSTAADSAANTDISGTRLNQIQAELSAAQNDRVSAQSHYETAVKAAPSDLPDILNDSLLRTIQDKLTDLQRQRAELLSTYTESNERVRKIDSQIPPLDNAYGVQRRSILNRIHDDYTMALRREALLKSSYAAQAGVVIDKTNKGIQYNILKRQVDSNQELYASMLEQVKRAGIASTIRASNVEVFDPAKPAQKPFSPNRVLNAGLGLVGGLFAGVLFIFFTYRGTLHVPGEFQTKTGLRELGVIPNGRAEFDTERIGRRLLNGGKIVAASTKMPSRNHELGEHSIELVSWSRKPSFTAESFRSLVTSILFAGDQGSRPRTIVLTSANAMEGKTTLTCNLGIAMAQVRGRVLLVDGDLRSPRLHQIFGLENEFGLATLLSRTFVSAQSDLKIQPTFIPGLFVLPAGPPTPAAANLFHSSHLPELLKTLRAQFDTVIIDTPPSLLTTDARLVGRLADAVILVVRAGRTSWQDAQRVVQQFDQDRTHVMGTVLNDARKVSRNFAYYRAAAEV